MNLRTLATGLLLVAVTLTAGCRTTSRRVACCETAPVVAASPAPCPCPGSPGVPGVVAVPGAAVVGH